MRKKALIRKTIQKRAEDLRLCRSRERIKSSR